MPIKKVARPMMSVIYADVEYKRRYDLNS